jgi:hypothetical protein
MIMARSNRVKGRGRCPGRAAEALPAVGAGGVAAYSKIEPMTKQAPSSIVLFNSYSLFGGRPR